MDITTHENGPASVGALPTRDTTEETVMPHNPTRIAGNPSTTPSTTKVIHVKDMPNYPDAVYIGRAMPRQGLKGSPFGNPFKSPRDADPIGKFHEYITNGTGRHLLARLPELRGKPLACWCVRDSDPPFGDEDDWRCHGDVLMDLLNDYSDDELMYLAVSDEVLP